MRRQYHARQTARGTLIWDVHRLIALSRDLPVCEVALSSLPELDEAFWFPPDTPAPTCRQVAEHAKLISDSDLAHPVILSSDGRVMDGMHRVCKAWIEGRTTIAAVRFEDDPEPDHIDVPLAQLSYEEPW